MHSRRAATECAPLPGPRLGLTGAESRATDPGELGLGRGGDAAAAVAGYTANREWAPIIVPLRYLPRVA